jgi:hypothetical protein
MYPHLKLLNIFFQNFLTKKMKCSRIISWRCNFVHC